MLDDRQNVLLQSVGSEGLHTGLHDASTVQCRLTAADARAHPMTVRSCVAVLSAPASTNSRLARTIQRSRVSFVIVEAAPRRARPARTATIHRPCGVAPCGRVAALLSLRCGLGTFTQRSGARHIPSLNAVDADHFVNESTHIYVVAYVGERPGGCLMKLTARGSRTAAHAALSSARIRIRVTAACITRSSMPGSGTTAPATSPPSTVAQPRAG